MGNTPSKTPGPKKRRPTSFYGKKARSIDENKVNRRKSLPATSPSVTPVKEYTPSVPARENLLSPLYEEEHEDLLDEHNMHRMTWKQNFMAPVAERMRNELEFKVLDVCCGNGRWMIDVAADFPQANFIGIDTTKPTPLDVNFQNVEFQEVDFFEKLSFDDETFDFIHCRSIHTRLTKGGWPILIDELVRITKIGGYIEFLEEDFNWLEEKTISKIIQPRALKDFDVKPSFHISRLLHESRCTNQVFHQVKQEKLGAWGGKVGKSRLQKQLLMLRNFKVNMLESIGMTSEEYDQTLESLSKELVEGQNYIMAHRFWIQKKNQ